MDCCKSMNDDESIARRSCSVEVAIRFCHIKDVLPTVPTHSTSLWAQISMLTSIYYNSWHQEVFYQSSFANSVALWNRANQQLLLTKYIEEIAKRKLYVLVPTCTRWNSYYNAVIYMYSVDHRKSFSELIKLAMYTKMEVHCFLIGKQPP